MTGRILRQYSGFTLIEVLVVIVIIAISLGVAAVGYDQVFSRKLDSEVEKMGDWFEAVAESAVFRSMVLGVLADENQFTVVAYYDNRWFHLNGIEPYEISQELQWELEVEEKIDFGQDLETEEREPFVAFLPSGQAMPEGTLSLHSSGEDSVILRWDDNADFELVLGPSET